MKKLSLIATLLAFLSISAFADIRMPEPPTPKPTATMKPIAGKQIDLMIDVTSEVSEPTLVIKKSSVKNLRAALDEAEGIDNLATQTESEGTKPSATIGSIQRVVGGLFLSLAFVFGGVWFVKNKPSKTAVALFFVAFFGASTVLVWGNIAPPRLFSISKNIFADEIQRYAYAKGKVRVKIVTESDADIKLLVPITDTSNASNDE
jgi:hypothetical protein